MRVKQPMTPALPSKAMSRSVDCCLFCWIRSQKLFFSGIYIGYPLGVLNKLRVSGGTLSAPAGCSPQGYGGLLAVNHSLYSLSFSFIRLGRMDFQTGGGTLSAPTGCSLRDCGRLLVVDHSLRECVSHTVFFLRSTGRLCLQQD